MGESLPSALRARIPATIARSRHNGGRWEADFAERLAALLAFEGEDPRRETRDRLSWADLHWLQSSLNACEQAAAAFREDPALHAAAIAQDFEAQAATLRQDEALIQDLIRYAWGE